MENKTDTSIVDELIKKGRIANSKNTYYDVENKSYVNKSNIEHGIIDERYNLLFKSTNSLNVFYKKLLQKHLPSSLEELIDKIRRRMKEYKRDVYKNYYVLGMDNVIKYTPDLENQFVFDDYFMLCIPKFWSKFFSTLLSRILATLSEKDEELFDYIETARYKPEFMERVGFHIDVHMREHIRDKLKELTRKKDVMLYYNVDTDEFEHRNEDMIYDEEFSLASKNQDLLNEIIDKMRLDKSLGDIMEIYRTKRSNSMFELDETFDVNFWKDRMKELMEHENHNYFYNPIRDTYVKIGDKNKDKYHLHQDYSLAFPKETPYDVIDKITTTLSVKFRTNILLKLKIYRMQRK